MALQSAATSRLTELLDPMVTSMGYHLVRVKMSGGRRKTLQIMAERPDGTMNVDDCADLSGALSALLDVEDPIQGEYFLEVSSPGIDRPLVSATDFERYQGHLAKIKMEIPLEGRKKFIGTLCGVDDGGVLLDMRDAAPDARRVKLAIDEMAEAQLVLTDQLIEESLREGKARNEQE